MTTTPLKARAKARRELIWSYCLKIILLDVVPTVWRVVWVPETITLPKLHTAIQIAMGWTNSHLHEFVIGGRHYTDYLDDDWGVPLVDERRVKLGTALGPYARTFDYLYDFGDDWHHAIIVEAREPVASGSVKTVTIGNTLPNGVVQPAVTLVLTTPQLKALAEDILKSISACSKDVKKQLSEFSAEL